MTPERWLQVEAVLQEALDRAPLERASFLAHACAGDEELKEEATSLIAAYDEAGGFIEQPAMAQDARVLLGVDTEGHRGRRIGPYRIIDRLGAGGMAEVYLAQDTRLNRLVALKLLPAYFASDDVRLRRFQSEARAASALNHPNILTIHEVGETDGEYFIATEFIDGQTIRELIEKHSLSLEDVLECVEQVASALAVAHAAGIVHRDIKPENIMRRPDGLVKILDFGIAKLSETTEDLKGTTVFRTQTEIGLVMGTVNYMSPEQARGLAVDERTDIWSLGVVLYEMLAGRLPFSGDTRADTVVAILDRAPAPLSGPANQHYRRAPLLQLIVDKCLRKEASGRYRKASEMVADLKKAREQLNNPAFHISGNERSSRFVRTMAGIGVLLLAATVGTLIYTRSGSPDAPAAAESTVAPAKLYSQMSERERLDFIAAQEQRISAMMGDRPVKLNEDAVRYVKKFVDWYASRMDGPPDTREGSARAVYERAPPYVPLIARSFGARRVPVIIGIYLPVIESGYRPCSESPNGAKGLFQFLPQTARGYGVAREDMCDAEKMTPAAAQYIADHMAELGEDAQSVTLVLMSYNRGADWVRETLRQLRGTENYERNFWTMLANREKLDDAFRRETAAYVPSFFAAAIVGENPEVFGLKTPPLSSLATNYAAD